MKKTFIIISLLIATVGSAQLTLIEPKKQELTISKNVKVFPNPATSVVNVLGLENCTRADITISDVNGNPVLKHQWAIRRRAINIPISNLASGIYMISIQSPNQRVFTKFYKQ